MSRPELNYIFTRSKKASGVENGYGYLIKKLRPMIENKEETDALKYDATKLHYLYRWVLRQLGDFHFKQNSEENQMAFVKLLITRSLYKQAYKFLHPVKMKWFKSENFSGIFRVFETGGW